jgi:hypothetical protein
VGPYDWSNPEMHEALQELIDSKEVTRRASVPQGGGHADSGGI